MKKLKYLAAAGLTAAMLSGCSSDGEDMTNNLRRATDGYNAPYSYGNYIDGYGGANGNGQNKGNTQNGNNAQTGNNTQNGSGATGGNSGYGSSGVNNSAGYPTADGETNSWSANGYDGIGARMPFSQSYDVTNF